MRFADIAKGPVWMTEEEHKLNRRWVNRMRRMLRERRVEDTPLLMLCLEEISVMQIVCRRLENSLLKDPEAVITPTLVEQMAKSRERLRKALDELEKLCPDNRPPAPQQNPNEMLMKKYLELKRKREAEEEARKVAVGEPIHVPMAKSQGTTGVSANPGNANLPMGTTRAPAQMLPGLAKLQSAEKATTPSRPTSLGSTQAPASFVRPSIEYDEYGDPI